jgi:hypothetical protein
VHLCISVFQHLCLAFALSLSSALDLSLSSTLVRRLFQNLGEIWFHQFFFDPYKSQHGIRVGVNLTLSILLADPKTIG